MTDTTKKENEPNDTSISSPSSSRLVSNCSTVTTSSTNKNTDESVSPSENKSFNYSNPSSPTSMSNVKIEK